MKHDEHGGQHLQRQLHEAARRRLPDRAHEHLHGQPGPQQNYNPLQDSAVVRCYSIIN